MRLIRQLLAVAVLAVLLFQQPFMLKTKSKRSKVVPLQLAISTLQVAASPYPFAAGAINASSQALLTPLEYHKAPKSKRTLSDAYAKAEQRLSRIEADANLRTLSDAWRTPSLAEAALLMPGGGAGLLTAGSLLAPLCPGAEFAVIAGCVSLWFGVSGMSIQPEFYFVWVIAILGLVARSSANAAETKPVQRRRRRRRVTDEHADCDAEPVAGSDSE